MLDSFPRVGPWGVGRSSGTGMPMTLYPPQKTCLLWRLIVYGLRYLPAVGHVGDVRLQAQQFGIGVHTLQHGNLAALPPRFICDAGRSASVKIDLV